MSEFLQYISPGGPNIHLKFQADGVLDILATAPYGCREDALTAISRAVQIVCRVDQEMLRNELRASGILEEEIESICLSLSLSLKDQFRLRDIASCRYKRKNC